MNRHDLALRKLLYAAAQSPRASFEPPSRSLETSVLARWRAGKKEDDLTMLLLLFRRATLFAIVVMALSGAWNYYETNASPVATALASYAMLQLPP
jgi:hypothetical protein